MVTEGKSLSFGLLIYSERVVKTVLSFSNIDITVCIKQWKASQVPLSSIPSVRIDPFILLIQKKYLLSTYYIISICSRDVGYNRIRYISIFKEF